jgi:hypothetical protein
MRCAWSCFLDVAEHLIYEQSDMLISRDERLRGRCPNPPLGPMMFGGAPDQTAWLSLRWSAPCTVPRPQEKLGDRHHQLVVFEDPNVHRVLVSHIEMVVRSSVGTAERWDGAITVPTVLMSRGSVPHASEGGTAC